jgi:hypothetical protein
MSHEDGKKAQGVEGPGLWDGDRAIFWVKRRGPRGLNRARGRGDGGGGRGEGEAAA